jgi:hypothetical protein
LKQNDTSGEHPGNRPQHCPHCGAEIGPEDRRCFICDAPRETSERKSAKEKRTGGNAESPVKPFEEVPLPEPQPPVPRPAPGVEQYVALAGFLALVVGLTLLFVNFFFGFLLMLVGAVLVYLGYRRPSPTPSS